MPAHSSKLKSSWLTDVHYDDATNTLTVTTAKGAKHEHQVSPQVYHEMLAAPSPGRFYNDRLKDK